MIRTASTDCHRRTLGCTPDGFPALPEGIGYADSTYRNALCPSVTLSVDGVETTVTVYCEVDPEADFGAGYFVESEHGEPRDFALNDWPSACEYACGLARTEVVR